jgi:tetratricopeptide (TPR) repeat protein
MGKKSSSKRQAKKNKKSKAAAPPSRPKASLSSKKKLLFAATTVVMFFVLAEVVLSVVGVEPAIRSEDPYVGFESYIPLFRPTESGSVLETAPNKLFFFNSQRFPARKTAGTVRIFTLGGSTTYGRPFEDTTSFTGWLRTYLKTAAPDKGWEVINCGAISYASYRVAKVMEELLEYEPDLFIIYSGNNEFLERRTYQEIIEEPAPLTGARLALSHSRTYTLIEKVLRPSEPPSQDRYELKGEVEEILNRSTGLDVYERDDVLAKQVLAHYRFNLRRMTEMARQSGAEVVLVTIPVNEKDFAPFKSQPSEGLAAADRLRFETLLVEASDLLETDNPDEAVKHLDEAIRIDPRYADAHYLRGRALIAQGAYEEAGQAFQVAIEEDVCPLRVLPGLNEAILDVARENRVPLVDFRTVLKAHMRGRYGHENLGGELFLDHVHPTVETNGLLARALVDRMTEMGVTALDPDWHESIGEAVAAEVEGRVDAEAHARAYKNLSKVLIWAGKKKEAEKYVREAEEQLTGDWEAHLNAGVLSLESDRTQEAMASFKEALRLNPGAAVAHNYLGAVYAAAGDLDQAIAEGEMAVRIDPDLVIAHNNLGTYYTNKGELERARSSIGTALALDPQYAEAHNNLGNIDYAAGRMSRAITSYDRALDIRPNYVEALTNRGLLLGELSRFPEAIESLNKAISIDGDWTPAYIGLGKAYLAEQRFVEARQSFERALELDAKSPEAYEWLARSLVAEGQQAMAKQVLKQGLREVPEAETLHYAYGQMLAQEENFEASIGHLQSAIQFSGDGLEAPIPLDELHHTLAGALLMSGQVEEGISQLERALVLNSDNVMALNDLGFVLEQLGRLDEALGYYRRALDLNPEFLPAMENLRRIEQRLGSTTR